MLDPNYLDHITDSLMQEYIDSVTEAIIADAARRIVKTGTITDSTEWQLKKLEQLSVYHDYVLSELTKAVNKSQDALLDLFDEVAGEALRADDQIYKAIGYNPIPLKENSYMQGIIWSAYERTNGTFFNLTRTTANTATRQFETILDQAHLRLSSGAFSYQDVIRWGVTDLANKGIASITYPSGHVDYLDVAFRRATMTGLNQAGLQLQVRRAAEMGCDYVETTAHAGARPAHALWQGRVFKLHGSEPDYPNFYTETGYGTGAGLGGWNCRHGFYPFFPGVSEAANTKAYLDELNNATVTYNGKEIPLYEATQKQRYIERNIRKWKRKYMGMDAAGLDTTESAVKLKIWREREKDFLSQTGLRQQASREQVYGFGRREAAKATWTAKKHTIQQSGGQMTYIERFEKREEQAKAFYDSVRSQNEISASDLAAIVNTTGFTENEVTRIFNHIFVDKHIKYDGSISTFDESYDMAVAWKRLREGSPQEQDILLLNHELLESLVEKEYNLTAAEAHAIAKETYDWEQKIFDLFGEEGEPLGLL